MQPPQPIECLVQPARKERIEQRVVHPRAGALRRPLAHDNPGEVVAFGVQHQLDPGLAGWPAPGLHDESLAGLALENLGFVLEQQRPGTERMVQRATDRGEAGVRVADLHGADDPVGIRPRVGEHSPDLVDAGRDVDVSGRHVSVLPTLKDPERAESCRPVPRCLRAAGRTQMQVVDIKSI